MLKDITFGQYFPGKSFIHRIDPRFKIVLVLAYIVYAFVSKNAYSLALSVLLALVIILVSRIPVKVVAKSLKPILPLVILTSILNMFYVDGKVLVDLRIMKITDRGLILSAFICIRIACLVAISGMLTYTTSPTDLTDALERLLSPLKVFKIKVHEIAMMMTIALRFIPTLIEETDRIMSAQKARGADMESGGLIKRVKALIPVLIPLLLSAFRRAYELAMAMESRCYRGGKGRTRLKVMKCSWVDFAATFTMLLVLGGIIFLNIWFGSVL